MWMLMSPWLHITTTTLTACFAAIQQICSVRCSLSRDALMMLVHALVVSKLDYCNSVLVGVSATLQWRLQSVLNAAARLVFSARRSAHIMSLLHAFHWLKVREWIQFPLCVLVHRCLHRSVLLNLEQMLHLFGWSPAHLRTIYDALCKSTHHHHHHLSHGVDSQHRLRSGLMSMLLILSTGRITLGSRAFPVAAATVWNTLAGHRHHIWHFDKI